MEEVESRQENPVIHLVWTAPVDPGTTAYTGECEMLGYIAG